MYDAWKKWDITVSFETDNQRQVAVVWSNLNKIKVATLSIKFANKYYIYEHRLLYNTRGHKV